MKMYYFFKQPCSKVPFLCHKVIIQEPRVYKKILPTLPLELRICPSSGVVEKNVQFSYYFHSDNRVYIDSKEEEHGSVTNVATRK
jgi:hypothetical protein